MAVLMTALFMLTSLLILSLRVGLRLNLNGRPLLRQTMVSVLGTLKVTVLLTSALPSLHRTRNLPFLLVMLVSTMKQDCRILKVGGLQDGMTLSYPQSKLVGLSTL